MQSYKSVKEFYMLKSDTKKTPHKSRASQQLKQVCPKTSNDLFSSVLTKKMFMQ